MTKEEKAKAIEKWCLQRDCNKTCPLFKLVNIEDEYELCYTMDDPVLPCNIDRNYDILVKAGLIAPDDEIETADDKVNHPNHYTKGGIECISAIRASMTADGFCDYCKGNVIKYIWRWRDKGGVQDLEKAKVYLDWMIEEMKGANDAET